MSAWANLRAQHRRFIEAWLTNGCNATAAARAIGRKGKGASQAAYLMMQRPDVRAAVKEILEPLQKISEDVVRAKITQAACADLMTIFGADNKVIPINEWSAEVRAAVQSVELNEDGTLKKAHAAPVLEARRLFLQMRKLLSDQHELTGKNGAPLVPPSTSVTPEQLAEAIRSVRDTY